MTSPSPTTRPAGRVVLCDHGLVITELPPLGAARTQAATDLMTSLAGKMVEFLQRRRGRTALARLTRFTVEEALVEWRDLLDWSGARLVQAHGSLVGEGVVEGSFTLLRGPRRHTFVCRVQHDGRRWTCVLLAPVGLLVPVRS
ncbi:Rv3235 family protein [Propionibacteriaceae bacterium Y1923]|uniref:Rv3235 family protein n=1 Tax=Aestuariimicrobium sp. Y1814 TaxID=3418742 RepID=UPI003C28056A